MIFESQGAAGGGEKEANLAITDCVNPASDYDMILFNHIFCEGKECPKMPKRRRMPST
jgi:hypothetical protein